MPRICLRNFTGGEVTPTLSARYDLKKAGTFLSCCENFITNLHGDIERRPGTHFIADVGSAGVLLPFRFNSEPENNYVIIFLNGEIKIGTSDSVYDASLPNPYAISDVYDISYAQVADVVYLAHKDHPLRKLYRSGSAPNYTWTIEDVALNQSLDAPARPSVSFRSGPTSGLSGVASASETLRYVVTAVDIDGIESLASDIGSCAARYPSDWISGDKVNVSWGAVSGAEDYNIYRESGGYYGLIGTVKQNTATGGSFIGLSAGAENLQTKLLSGSIVRNRAVGGDGRYDYKLDMYRNNYDNTSALNVSANSGQNAFYLASLNKLFIRVTKTTNTRTWGYVDTSYRDGDGNYIKDGYWEYSDTSSSEVFWAVVDGSGVGTYSSHSVLNGAGTDSLAPMNDYKWQYLHLIHRWSAGTTLTFEDQNFEPDTSKTPKIDWNPFVDGNNPATVIFHQQRMVLAGGAKSPATFYMSRTGDYENFRKSHPVQDDDPVEYMLASGSIDDVKWATSFGDLLIGTAGTEFNVKSSGASITPSDVQITTGSYWGSAGVQPIIIGSSVLLCQRSGYHVRDLAYSWEQDGYSGNDLSLLSPHLVEGHQIKQWAFQQTPGSNVWIVREDGTMLCLTYMKEQQVYSWSRHVTDGKVLSVAALSGKHDDVVMLLVERTVGDRKKYFLERLADRFNDTDDIKGAFFVDCGKTYSFDDAVTEVADLGHLEGRRVSVLADGSPEEDLTVTGGKLELLYPAKKVVVGLPYTSVLCPMPVETDGQTGSTLGKRRAYGKVILRVHRSVGGSYAATQDGDMWNSTVWKQRTWYDIPFLPEVYGEACVPFSGDIELALPSGQYADTAVWVKQDRPMPMRIVSIIADIDFGEQ